MMLSRSHTWRGRGAAWPAIVLLCLALGSSSALAQQDEGDIRLQDVDEGSTPSLTLTLVLPADQFEPGGPQPDFEIWENGAKISTDEVVSLGTAEREPIDVVLVFDLSGSMKGTPLIDAVAAARAFSASLAPEDQIAVVTFSSSARLDSGFTPDRVRTDAALGALEAGGETALYDAVVTAAEIAATRGMSNTSLVVLSDGGDTGSTRSLDDAVGAALAAGAPVYAVALESPEHDPAPLRTITEATGGRTFSAADSGELESQFEVVAQELQNLYAVTFKSREPNTKELEIDITATLGDRSASLETAIDNPLFGQAPTVETAIDEYRVAARSDPVMLVATVILFFVAIALLVIAVGLLFARNRTGLDQLEFYDQLQASSSDDQVATTDEESVRARMVEAVGWVAGRRGFTQVLHAKLEQAGLPLRPLEYMYLHIVTVLTVGFVAGLLTGDYLVALLLVFLTVFGPLMWLEFTIDRRRRAFEEQLPDILSLIAGSMRSGWGLLQSLDLVVKETADPASVEFRRVEAEARLGLPLSQALEKMARRLDSEDFRWVVVAINVQREVGGNLSEVLDILSDTMRDRSELRRHVRSLTAEGRLSAVVLYALPFVVLLALSVISPTYLTPMFSHPAGIGMLLVGMGLLIVGGLWLWRAIKVEI